MPATVAAGVAGLATQLRAAAARAAVATKASMGPRPTDPENSSPRLLANRFTTTTNAPDPQRSAPPAPGGADATVEAPAVDAPDLAVGGPVFPVSHPVGRGRPALRAAISSMPPPASAAPIPPPTRRPSRVRKARLRLLRVDPWSVMKTAFLLSIAVGVMVVVSVAVVWSVLDAAGVFSSVGDLVRDVSASETSPGFEISAYIGLPRVLGLATLLSVVDVVLITALATLGAFLYNLSASLLGGLELTLAEDD